MRDKAVWMALFYLRFWAKLALKFNKPYVIGVAGSVGKSSTRNALNAMLKDHFKTKVVSGNSETGVPMGILGIPIQGFTKKQWLSTFLKAPFKINSLKNVQYLIVEMGIDDPYPPKNMSYLLTIVKPDMAIDLNATATHTQQFEKVLKKHTKDSLEFIISKIAEEDSKIITNGFTKVGIYNRDDKRLTAHIEKKAIEKSIMLLTFGSDKNNSLYFVDYKITPQKTKFTYGYIFNGKEKTIDLSFPKLILPPASRESFAAVLLVGRALGLDYDTIKVSLQKNFTIPKGRSSLFEGIKNTLIIDSSYNSSKSTVLSFIEMVKKLKEKTGKKAVFIMGDMRELGKEAKSEHEEVAKEILPVIDELHCVGQLTYDYVIPYIKEHRTNKSATQKVEWFKNSVQLGLHLKEVIPENAIVLVKGSQNTIFLEESIKFLLKNTSDIKYLTRQDDYWLDLKQKFFSL